MVLRSPSAFRRRECHSKYKHYRVRVAGRQAEHITVEWFEHLEEALPQVPS
jgi:hypothetical protein